MRYFPVHYYLYVCKYNYYNLVPRALETPQQVPFNLADTPYGVIRDKLSRGRGDVTRLLCDCEPFYCALMSLLLYTMCC